MHTTVILILDNYDSFTFNLKDYIEQAGAEVLVIRNDQITIPQIERLKPEGIVISPGPKNPMESGITMLAVENFAGKIPLLGVCLGHQAIGLYAGGNLAKASYPLHGKVSTVEFQNHPMFRNIDQPMKVCRYHSLIIEELPDEWVALGYAGDGALMAFAHRDLLIWAVQFHPEAILTTSGLQLIRNWYDEVKNASEWEKRSTKRIKTELE